MSLQLQAEINELRQRLAKLEVSHEELVRAYLVLLERIEHNDVKANKHDKTLTLPEGVKPRKRAKLNG